MNLGFRTLTPKTLHPEKPSIQAASVLKRLEQKLDVCRDILGLYREIDIIYAGVI